MDAGLMWAPCLTGGLNGICIKLNLFHLSHQIHTLNLVPWIEYEIAVIQDEFEKLIWYHCAQSVLGKKGRWHSKEEVNLWNISSRLFVSDRVRGTDPILLFFCHNVRRVLAQPFAAMFHPSYGTLSYAPFTNQKGNNKVYASKLLF